MHWKFGLVQIRINLNITAILLFTVLKEVDGFGPVSKEEAFVSEENPFLNNMWLIYFSDFSRLAKDQKTESEKKLLSLVEAFSPKQVEAMMGEKGKFIKLPFTIKQSCC